MRGAPLIEALFALAVLLALAWPIRALTTRGLTAHGQPEPAPAVKVVPATPVRLELIGTAPSFEFSVSYLGREIWSGTGHQSPSRADLQLPVPKEGIEFEVKARFPDSNMHAVRLTLTTEESGIPIDRSAWGADALDEVLLFQPAA